MGVRDSVRVNKGHRIEGCKGIVKACLRSEQNNGRSEIRNICVYLPVGWIGKNNLVVS